MQATTFFQRLIYIGHLRGVMLIMSLILFLSVASATAEDSISIEDLETLNNLSAFITELESKHPQLKISKAEMEAAEARTRAASRPLYNPELELDAERIGFNGNKVDTVTVGVSQTIDWHDKRAAREAIALADQQLNLYDQEAIRQQLIADIFLSLAIYQAQREILSANTNRLTLMNQVLEQAELLYQAGDISKLDLEQLRLTQSKAQLIHDQAVTQLAISRQNLVTATGSSQNNWPTLPDEPPILESNKIDYGKILTELPAYKSTLTRITVASNTMQLRALEKKADPTFGFRVGDEESDTVVGLTLSIPLNIRNNFQAEVDEADANIRASRSSFNNTEHQYRTRLKSAATAYELNYAAWQSWQTIATSSLQKQSSLLLRLWKAGELSTSDYLLQLNQIREAEMNNVELKGNLWKSWFNWLAISNQFQKWLDGSLISKRFEK